MSRQIERQLTNVSTNKDDRILIINNPSRNFSPIFTFNLQSNS